MTDSWWAKKMGQAPQQAPQQRQYPPAQHQGPTVPQRQYVPPPEPQAPEDEPEGLTEALRTKQYRTLPQQATGHAQSSTCPGCGSTNYMAQIGNAAGHCHDCGYPTVQAGSGLGSLGGVRGSGAAHAAASPTYGQQLGRN